MSRSAESSNPQPAPSRNGPAWAAAGAMGLFLAWLFLPVAYAWLHRGGTGGAVLAHEQNRRPLMAGKPLADRLRDFSLRYEKSSPIRQKLIPLFAAFKIHILGISSVTRVVVGSGHWLFMGQENNTIDERRYFLGTRPFQDADLALWLRVLRERRDWLARRGIGYLLVIAPNKSSIYPERMPSLYPRGRKTRTDQIQEYLKLHAPGFPLLDLRQGLREGKKAREIYWPTDTHWNDFGKYLAYREIVRSLATRFPALNAIPEKVFEVRPCRTVPHDLEDILLLPWKAPGSYFRMLPRQPLPSSKIWERKHGSLTWRVFRSPAAELPLAVFVHDSFGDTLKALLSSHFRRSLWILDRDHGFPSAWIDKRRPCLVVDEIVERYLDAAPWTNPEQLRK